MLMHRFHESFKPGNQQNLLYGRVTVLVDGSWDDGLKVEIIYADNGDAIPMKVAIPGMLLDAPRAEQLSLAINHALGIAAAQQQKHFNIVIWR